MDWFVYVELVVVAILIIVVISRIIKTIKDEKLLPLICTAIEEAELQDGLTGEEKLNYAIEYIKREATTKGISVDIAKTVKLIETLVSLTKKVNFK